ncbi:unnamed protein product [Cuscuta europaea]|uniref:Protein kinase domain-containing protein n=3 Tax=Cuscuta europaea TaxID=41803 RepID=A0A9P0ZM12_CUSEU|nr:unnamed protein product [Cuscuta europaea]
MDELRQIGEVVGSLKALMVLEHEIQINQRQCRLLADIFFLAFDTISDEIRQNLRLHERNTKWKVLERPLRELHRIYKEGESYVKYCLDIKNWWGKVITLHLNSDCVEFHIHNLLCCFPLVIEAIETAAEISGGLDGEEDGDIGRMRGVALMSNKYGSDWIDQKLFMWKFGKQYLVPRDICIRLERVWREDKWSLLEDIRKQKNSKLGEGLIKKLDEFPNANLLHSSILLRSNDYSVKRRIGSGGTTHLKEINWLDESFALRTFYGDAKEPHIAEEISLLLSLSHPNVLQYHCGFYDEEKKEGFLLMDLMSKSLDVLVKENNYSPSQKKRVVAFSIPIAVDIMLQIARGMEYLHSRKIYHGELNPSNVLLKPRNFSAESCYFHAKVAGFGLSSIKRNYTYKTSPMPNGSSLVWAAPEVLDEGEDQHGSKCLGEENRCLAKKYSEKADVYSFSMLCFQLLTGKVPFEDGERPIGGKIGRYLRAGERPLFPHPSPRYLVNLIRKCWQTDPTLRPNFSSICRVLRYIKKVLIMNPEHGQPDYPPPPVDYCDIEASYSSKKLEASDGGICVASEIPFQMFAYKVVEKEKTTVGCFKENPDSSLNECVVGIVDDDVFSDIIDTKDLQTSIDQRSVMSEVVQGKSSADQRLAKTPEKKNLSNGLRLLTTIPEKKNLSFSEIGQSSAATLEKATAASKPANSKFQAKDTPYNKRFKDTKAGKLRDQSPVPFPGRITRAYSSPGFSAPGFTRTSSSLVASPIHPQRACSSPSRGPPARTTDCQSVVSLRGQRKAQEKDAEIP